MERKIYKIMKEMGWMVMERGWRAEEVKLRNAREERKSEFNFGEDKRRGGGEKRRRTLEVRRGLVLGRKKAELIQKYILREV